MRRIAVAAAALWLYLACGVAAEAADPCDVSLSFVDFGRIHPRHGDEITGEVVVRCRVPTQFALSLSPGHGDYNTRRLRGPGGAELKYNLFLDPGRRRVWGDGVTGGTVRLAGQSDGHEPALFTVYGRIPGGQSGPAGAYSDQLAVTLEP